MAVNSTKKKSKPVPKLGVQQGPASVGVGDEVRMPSEVSNTFAHYDPRHAQAGRGADSIQGLICSIREVRTGKLVGKTKGDLSGYVLEVLQNRTFHPQYSGNKNSGGPRGPVVVSDNPNWVKVKGLLKDGAKTGGLLSLSAGCLDTEPFVGMLDGWRVVKVHANLVELL